MAGVLIYKSVSRYYSYIIEEDSLYELVLKGISKTKDEIVWKKGNVSLKQLESARKTKDDLVRRLNEGEEADLEKEIKELEGFFK
jgi:hypothetical protein